MFSMEMLTLQELRRCINCGIKMQTKPLIELPEKQQAILKKWTILHTETLDDGFVCLQCAYILSTLENDDNPQRVLGHLNVCIGCGRSILRQRHLKVNEEDCRFMWPWYPNFSHSRSCRGCYTRLQRRKKRIENFNMQHKGEDTNDYELDNSTAIEAKQSELSNINEVCCIKSTENTNSYELDNSTAIKAKQSEPSHIREICCIEPAENISEDFKISLPFKRVIVRSSLCIVCKTPGPGLRTMESHLRRRIFVQHNILLTRRAVLCSKHAHDSSWQSCLSHARYTNIYKGETLVELFNMLGKPSTIIDFDRINEMPDHICKYWTGLKAEEFIKLYEKLNVDTSQFSSLRNALAIHLLKKKTGDSLGRLANLFSMTVSNLSKQLFLIENSFQNMSTDK